MARRDGDAGVRLAIPPLVSGGVMLSYHCTNACRHCMYRCSPGQPDEWLTSEMTESIFGVLARERLLEDVHLAGGEPMMRPELVLEVIRTAVRNGVQLSYVETNAFWCDDRKKGEAVMRRWKEEGLPAVLVSASMFHNEFVPFRNTRSCVEAALEVFGPGGTFVYLPQTYALLAQLPDDGTHTLEEFKKLSGIAGRADAEARLYSVIPNGRAARSLRSCYAPQPADYFAEEVCAAELLNVTHFHIDHHGDLFTGFCAGLAPATCEDLHPRITAASHPVFHLLAVSGPVGLMRSRGEAHGYRERAGGYVSKCDLCMDVRGVLSATGAYPELRPASFYENP